MHVRTNRLNDIAREWIRTRFGDAVPEDAAVRHVLRIVDGAESPEEHEVMPESAGVCAIVEGWIAERRNDLDERGLALLDSLLAGLRHRITLGEPLLTDPFADRDSGVPSRHLFLDRLETAIALGHRHNTLLAVCSIRLDLAAASEHLGRVMREVADRLRHTVRAVDTVARLGNDEFGLVVADLRRREDALVAVQKVADVLWEPYDIGETAYVIAPRIGMSFYPAHGHEPSMLLDRAREAGAGADPMRVYG